MGSRSTIHNRRNLPLSKGFVFALASVACAVSPGFAQSNVTWDNASGGTFIGAGSNYAGGTAPVTGDNVFFDTGVGATYTVTLDSDYTMRQWRNRDGDSVTFDLNANTLTLDNNVDFSGVTNLQNGTLNTNTVLATSNLFGRGSTGAATVDLDNVSYTSDISVIGSGSGASGSSVTVGSGSTFQVDENLIIGSGTGADNNTLQVSGAGSAITANDISTGQGVRMGNSSTDGNRVEVLNGASFTTNTASGSDAFRVGSGAGSKNNELLVSGSGSSFANNTSGNFESGQNDSNNQNNAATITAGASFSSDGSVRVLGSTGSNNSFTVSDGATANFNDMVTRANLVGGAGTLTVDDATLNTENLWVNTATATFQVLDGADVSVTNSLEFGDDAVLQMDVLNGNFQTMQVGTVVDAGTGSNINLDILSLDQTGTITLITASGSGSDFGSISLNSVPAGFEASTLSFDSNNLFLNAVPEPETYALVFGLMALGVGLAKRKKRV